MNSTSAIVTLLAVPALLAALATAPVTAAEEDALYRQGDQARLETVIRFADNVLEHGRDRYGPTTE